MGKSRRFLISVLLCTTVLLTSACGGSNVRLSPSRVERVFSAHGLHPVQVFDTRTATEADIKRLTRPSGKNDAFRIPLAANRLALRRIVHERRAHPLTWLEYKSVGVVVYGKVTDAESFARLTAESFAKEETLVKAQGGQPANNQVKRIGNAVFILPATPPPRVQAAINELTSPK